MSLKEHLTQYLQYLDFLCYYEAIKLGHVTMCTFVLLPVILLIRRIIPVEKVMSRAALWLFFLPVPFLGKLTMFYEKKFVVLGTFWWQNLCGLYRVVRVGVCVAVFMCLFLLCIRTIRLRRAISRMRTYTLYGKTVRVTDGCFSPFSFGVIRPQIVLSRQMTYEISEEELKTVILHEETHIRMGHTAFLFFWNILCCLTCCNPLMWMARSLLKEDLEALCDYGTIHKGTMDAYRYGHLVLHGMRFVDHDAADLRIAFSGPDSAKSFRNRILAIRNYRAIGSGMIKCYTAMAVVCLLLYSAVIVKASYPLYSRAASMVAVDKTLTNVYLEDNDVLQSAVQVTPGDVTVHTAAFRKLLQNNDFAVTEDTVWLYFGSYYKIPGIGLGGNIIEVNLADDRPVQTIPYETEEDFQTLLLKYMF